MRNFTCWGRGAGFQLSGKRVIIGTINKKKMDCAPLRPNKTRFKGLPKIEMAGRNLSVPYAPPRAKRIDDDEIS